MYCADHDANCHPDPDRYPHTNTHRDAICYPRSHSLANCLGISGSIAVDNNYPRSLRYSRSVGYPDPHGHSRSHCNPTSSKWRWRWRRTSTTSG